MWWWVREVQVVDHAAGSLHTTLVDEVLPAAERVVFRLGELHGLARWHPEAEAIGLTAAALQAALALAQRVLLLIPRFLRLATSTAAEVRMIILAPPVLTASSRALPLEPQSDRHRARGGRCLCKQTPVFVCIGCFPVFAPRQLWWVSTNTAMTQPKAAGRPTDAQRHPGGEPEQST